MNEVKEREPVESKAHKKRKKNKNKTMMAESTSDANSPLSPESQNSEIKTNKKRKKKKKAKTPSSSSNMSLSLSDTEKIEACKEAARESGSGLQLVNQQSDPVGKVSCLPQNVLKEKMSLGPPNLSSKDASSSSTKIIDPDFVISHCPYFTSNLLERNDNFFRSFKENPELLEAFLQNYHSSQCLEQAQVTSLTNKIEPTKGEHSPEQTKASLLTNIEDENKNSKDVKSSNTKGKDAVDGSQITVKRYNSEKISGSLEKNADDIQLSSESSITKQREAITSKGDLSFNSCKTGESFISCPDQDASLPSGDSDHSLAPSGGFPFPLDGLDIPKDEINKEKHPLDTFLEHNMLIKPNCSEKSSIDQNFQSEASSECLVSFSKPPLEENLKTNDIISLSQEQQQSFDTESFLETAENSLHLKSTPNVDEISSKQTGAFEDSDLTKQQKSILQGSSSQGGSAKNKVEKSVTFKLEPETKSPMSQEEKNTDNKTKAQLKAERKAAFEAQRAAELKGKCEGGDSKSKSELRAERRAKQEAQREAKLAKKGSPASLQGDAKTSSGVSQTKVTKENSPSTLSQGLVQAKSQGQLQLSQESKSPPSNEDTTSLGPAAQNNHVQSESEEESQEEKVSTAAQPSLQSTSLTEVTTDAGPVPFICQFNHLTKDADCLAFAADLRNSIAEDIPLYIQRLGVQLAHRNIYGTTARFVCTLGCLQKAVKDYQTPKDQQLSRDLEAQIKKYSDYLNNCRPHSPSTEAAIKDIRQKIMKISPTLTDQQAKETIAGEIDKFASEEIDLAMQSVVPKIADKIRNGSHILTYLSSSILREAFIKAHTNGVKFQVSIVDSGPHYEGRDLLRELTLAGVDCTYLSVAAGLESLRSTGISHVMLGVCALHSDGALLARAGTAQLCLAARHSPRRISVMACCLSFKISDIAFIESCGHNELGITEELKDATLSAPPMQHHLNLQYDIVPMELFDMVASEKGVHPCSSVPVLNSRKQDAR